MRFVVNKQHKFVCAKKDSKNKFVVVPNTPPTELEVVEPESNNAKTTVTFNKGKGVVMGYNFYLDDLDSYLGQMIVDPMPMPNEVYPGTAFYPGFYPENS